MDPIGGISPNPDQAPTPDPMQPQTTNMPSSPAQPMSPQPMDPGFASVPVTDPKVSNPSSPFDPAPSAPIDPMATMMDTPVATPMPTQKKSSGKMKTVLLILLVIILMGGASAGAYFVGYTAGKSAGKQAADAEYQQQQAAQQQETSSKTTTDTPKDLDLSTQVDPDYSKSEALEGTLGKTVQNADGFVMRVNNIERGFTTDDPSFTADPAKELVKVNFQMGNASKAKTMDINSTPFKLVDSTGAEILPTTLADYEGKFDTTKLDPGSQSSASLVFSVKKDDTPLKFVRKQPYRVRTATGDSNEVTFTITIDLSKSNE